MFFKKKTQVAGERIPSHIGIIMDGNGRWAKKRGLPRSAGHKVGADNFKKITRYAARIGVKYLTFYAFSTENWKRPTDEVSALMGLFRQYLEEALRDFLNENIKVKFIGDTTKFAPELRRLIREVEEVSSVKTGMTLNLAMNYGGRDEIIRAAKNIARDYRAGDISLDSLNTESFAGYLYTRGQPDPEMIVRPSGEMRSSNFMLWQSAYSEFIFLDKLWPDFKEKDLDECIRIFNKRSRRFGGA